LVIEPDLNAQLYKIYEPHDFERKPERLDRNKEIASTKDTADYASLVGTPDTQKIKERMTKEKEIEKERSNKHHRLPLLGRCPDFLPELALEDPDEDLC